MDFGAGGGAGGAVEKEGKGKVEESCDHVDGLPRFAEILDQGKPPLAHCPSARRAGGGPARRRRGAIFTCPDFTSSGGVR